MARFSNLPPELVGTVANYVEPLDLVNFVLASKAVFQSSEKAVQTHQRLKKLYQKIDLLVSKFLSVYVFGSV